MILQIIYSSIDEVKSSLQVATNKLWFGGFKMERKHEFDSCYNLSSSEFLSSDDSSSTFGIRIIGEGWGTLLITTT